MATLPPAHLVVDAGVSDVRDRQPAEIHGGVGGGLVEVALGVHLQKKKSDSPTNIGIAIWHTLGGDASGSWRRGRRLGCSKGFYITNISLCIALVRQG